MSMQQEAPFEIIFNDPVPARAPAQPAHAAAPPSAPEKDPLSILDEPAPEAAAPAAPAPEPEPAPASESAPEPGPVAETPATPPTKGVVRLERWLKVLHMVLIIGLIVTAVSLVRMLGRGDTGTAGTPETPAKKDDLAKADVTPKVEPKTEPKVEPKTEPNPEPRVEPKVEPKPEPKVESKPEPKVEPKPEPKPGLGHETKPNGDDPKKDPPAPNLEELQVASLLEEAAECERTDPAKAIGKYQKVLELRPARTELWKNIADLHLARDDRDEATRAYRTFLKHHPTRADGLNNLGVLALQAGRFEEAQRCLEAAIEIAPTANTYYNLGNLHLRRNELDRAAAAYRRTLEYDAKHERARFNLAIVLERQGRLAEASAMLATLVVDSPEAGRERVRIEAMMGGAEAKRALDTARQSSDVALVLAAASGFRKANELEKALALLDRAVDLSPSDPTALTNRGVLRQAIGRLADAVADYEAAIKADPSFADAHFNLGVLREERGELVKALEHYTAAVKARPSMAPAHNNIGALYLKVNQPQKALECFNRAVKHDPDFAPARLNLGWAWLALNQKERALEELKAYVSLVPKDQRDPNVIPTIEKLEKKP